MSKKPINTTFSTLLPPPNLTGVLHLGHIWNATLQDVAIRTKQILGYETYWGYGFDHAGLSLQIKFEQELKKNKIIPSSLSKEEYFLKINEWKEENAKKIQEQFQLFNFSLPYSEKNYTFDSFSEKFVIEKFIQLYKEGLIYESEKLINWDHKLQTAISDIEVSYREQNGQIFYLKYFLENKEDFIWVATTRIETIFGDVAIFVNDKDEEKKKYIGQKVFIPLTEKLIPILADASVSADFASGFMKCTPAHDFLDWNLGIKHKLDLTPVFDSHLKMNEIAGEYFGLDKDECKSKIIEILEAKNELRIEPYKNKIAYSERSGAIIEPLISKQWFLKSSVLSKNALDVLSPKQLHNIFFQSSHVSNCQFFLQNMNDWCISRQMKWGIRIPVYKNNKTNEVIVSSTNPGLDYEQIPDVLDTWFSSSLWPLIVFNKEKKSSLSEFFPIDFLASGRDILFFWICKMIFMSWHFEKKIPFKKIYLHGLILNKDGQKMSKSLNNGVTPEDLIKKYSDNVLRLFFLLNTVEDHNIKYLENKIDFPNKFVHKFKNAVIFFKSKDLMGNSCAFNEEKLCWYEKIFLETVLYEEKKFLENIRTYNFSKATKKITNVFWDMFCSDFIELTKLNANINENSKNFITFIWKKFFGVFWTITPSLAEEQYEELFNKKLCYEERKYIEYKHDFKFEKSRWFFDYLDLSRKIYNELKLSRKEKIYVNIVVEGSVEAFKNKFCDVLPYFQIMNHEIKEIKKKRSENKVLDFMCGEYIFEFLFDSSVIEEYVNFVKRRIVTIGNEIEKLRNLFKNKDLINVPDSKRLKDSRIACLNYENQLHFYEEWLETRN